MNNIIKKISITFAAIATLLAIAILLLVLFVNPNHYKSTISQKVLASTGRTLIIDGKINWTIFPWLGLELPQLKLSNAPGFGDKPFAQIKKAQVSIRLLPLLIGKLEVGNLGLDGLTLYLTKNSQGKTNWDDLIASANHTQPTNAAETAALPSKTVIPLRSLAISSLTITQANIYWNNQQTGHETLLQDFSLKSKNITLEEQFPLQMAFTLHDKKNEMSNKIELSTSITINLTKKYYQLADLWLNSIVSGKKFGSNQIKSQLIADAKFDLNKENLDINPFILQVAKFKLSGKFSGTQVINKPSYKGIVTIDTFNPKELLHNLGVNYSPRTTTAMQSASGKLEFTATNTSANVEKLELQLDKTSLTGKASISNFTTFPTTFFIYLNNINIDNYLPIASTAQNSFSPIATANAAATPASNLIPVQSLQQLNMNGTVEADSVTVANLSTTAVRAKINAQNGILVITPTASLYQGKSSGSITLDTRPSLPTISINENLSNIQASPLLNDLMDVKQIYGVMNANMSLTMRGQNPNALKQSLSGRANFIVKNGHIEGIDIGQMIRVAGAIFNKKDIPGQRGANQTDFGTLSASAIISNGVMSNNDLLLLSPAVKVTGNGKINIVQSTIDYHLLAMALGSLDPVTRQIQDLMGGGIPILIHGSLLNPTKEVDKEAIAKAAAKGLLKQHEQKIQKKIEDALPENLKQEIKKLPFFH